MEKRLGHRSMGQLALAAAVGLFGYGVSQADAGLVIDIRATAINGVPVATDSDDAPEAVGLVGPGGVVSLDVVARVSGTNTLPDEYFKAIHGLFRTSTGGLLGDLAASNVAPFNVISAQPGTPIDYDSDGDLDIGSTQNSGTAAHFWVAFANPAVADGTVVANDPSTEEFLIGRLTFTVGADPNGETFINFLDRRYANSVGTDGVPWASWNEDGTGTESVRNGFTPFTVDGVTIGAIPEPTGIALAGVAALGLLARRRNSAACRITPEA